MYIDLAIARSGIMTVNGDSESPDVFAALIC
jgi:hypothetical protein